MTKITKTQAFRAGNKLGINFEIVDLDMFRRGMNIEMEHGRRHNITNITNDNLLSCAKIALAHIMEYPDYYIELEKMEEKLKKKWKGRRRPQILI